MTWNGFSTKETFLLSIILAEEKVRYNCLKVLKTFSPFSDDGENAFKDFVTNLDPKFIVENKDSIHWLEIIHWLLQEEGKRESKNIIRWTDKN